MPRGGAKLCRYAAFVVEDLRSVPVQPVALEGISLRADLRENVWYPLWRWGRYPHQVGEERVLAKILKTTSIVFDIGANIGYLTLFCALRCRGGNVVAFEPSPRIRRFLEDNAKLVPNIRVEAFALSDRPGTAEFVEEELSDRSHLGSGPGALHVPMTTVDIYCSMSGLQPDVLKIDVEGHDHRVLLGATATLANSVRAVMFEALEPASLNACLHALRRSSERWVVSRISHDGSLCPLDRVDERDGSSLTNNYLATR